ncbi:hypothetical protein ABPG74_019830 [Tetrahymena malaccensis]
MRFISFVVLTLVTLHLVSAASSSQKEQVVECLMSISTQDPCQNEDKLCEEEKIKIDGCIQTCISNGAGGPFSGMKDCIQQNCNTQNQNMKLVVNQSIQCLSSQTLKSSFILLLALLSLIF